MTKRALWQGRADSLCGIYCLLYVIRKLEVFGENQSDRDRRALHALLKSAERQNLLTADLIAGVDAGYETTALIAVFNGLPPRHRGGFQAKILKHVVPSFDGKASHLKDFLKGGGFAILDVEKSEHWVCAKRIDSSGVAVCFDPSAKRQTFLCKKAFTDDGVALMLAGGKAN